LQITKAEITKTFLSAQWCNLVHLSFYVSPEILQSIKPPNIELDKIGNNAVISLVAFDFKNTAVNGIPLPFYGNFPEVNLRYYVRDNNNTPGVVFIKELVPKTLVAAAANTIYNEKYNVVSITSNKQDTLDILKFNYFIDEEYEITAITEARSIPQPENSIKHFIKQRSAGFGVINGKTISYEVEHGLWEIFPVINFTYKIDFGRLFGPDWRFLNNEDPFDVTVAKGSHVNVYDWQFCEF
jgi:uncharacterized protein